jgi:hypothetical protein
MATASRSVRSEDVRHLLLELVAGDAVPDEVKSALAPVLYAVTGALVADRTMAEQGDGSAHLGGDEDNERRGAATAAVGWVEKATSRIGTVSAQAGEDR